MNDSIERKSAAPPGIAHKAVPFTVKSTGDDGSGWFEGIAAGFHNIDSVGDIIDPAAFNGTIDRFIATGFLGGVGHDWNVPTGHPAAAKALPEGLWLKGVYDDVPAAQAVRGGMKVHPETGRATIRTLSIGYAPNGPAGASRFESKDAVRSYWDANGYTPSDQDLSRLESFYTPRFDDKGKKFTPGIRLLKDVNLYEVSPVLIPANDRAVVMGVKGEYLGDTGRAVAFAALERLHSMLGTFLWMCLYDEKTEVAEKVAKARAGIDEFRDALAGVLSALLGDGGEAAAGSGAVISGAEAKLAVALNLPPSWEADDRAPESFKSLQLITSKDRPGSGLSLDDHSRMVGSAVAEYLGRVDARQEARFKEGRMLSRANIDEIEAVAASMESGSGRLRKLMAKARGESEAEASAAKADETTPEAEPAETTPNLKDLYRREMVRHCAVRPKRLHAAGVK